MSPPENEDEKTCFTHYTAETATSTSGSSTASNDSNSDASSKQSLTHQETSSENDNTETSTSLKGVDADPIQERSEEKLTSRGPSVDNTRNINSDYEHNFAYNWTLAPELSSFQTSLKSKSSPLGLKPWVKLSQTLDGRDKITKVIQYSSRLLGFYYESMLHSSNNSNMKAKQFRMLQKALTQARKPFRFGKSLNEVQKLRDMGFIHWVAWYLRQTMFNDDKKSVMASNDSSSTLESRKEESEANDYNSNSTKEAAPSSKCSQPSSIIVSKDQQLQATQKDSLSSSSYIGSMIYNHLSTYIDETKVAQDETGMAVSKVPPKWKVLTSALKIIGLAGFWAGDNVAYLHTTGFLCNNPKQKKESALFATRSYFFACVVGLYLSAKEWAEHRNGELRNAFLHFHFVDKKCKQMKMSQGNDANSDVQDQLQLALTERDQCQLVLDQAKKKHAKLCLALLKSCCDVTVFSNNPGVDLHLKYRGKKMNEGIQCVAGITSALTVIFNNYV